MREAAALGPGVERQNGIGAECTKAHGRDVENAGVVRLGAAAAGAIDAAVGAAVRTCRRVAANPHFEIVRRHGAGLDGVVHPLIALGLHVQLRAKGPLVRVALGALVHQRALRPRERGGLRVALQKILPHLRANKFQHKSQVADDGVVAQH